ncbi:MAG: resistance-nodulation-cell division efflux membrane fusion protein [Candidatus Binatia bacterium]|nr:MAG: resistance-nodulation-cell division efflux membrane fusion protein [Candidatus Binatia bacterium]
MLLFLAAAALATACRSAESRDATESHVVVRVASARTAEVPDVLQLVGTLEARERVAVAAEVAGTVRALHADLGDSVEAGAVLVELDDRTFLLRRDAARAALEQARAVLARVRRDHERMRELRRKEVVPPGEFDRVSAELAVAEANVEAAASQLALAEKALSDTRILAPFAGEVSSRWVSVGTFVTPGQPLLELVQSRELELRLEVPERASGRIRPGLPVRVATDAFPGQEFEARIARVGASLDARTRTLPVEALVPNSDGKLRPGQFARATIEFGVVAAVVVPRSAVSSLAGTERVFVIGPQSRVESRVVELGMDLGEDIVVRNGLRAGEIVAVSHLERLRDGVAVVVDRGAGEETPS